MLDLWGFKPKIFGIGHSRSDNVVDINGNNTIFVDCDLIMVHTWTNWQLMIFCSCFQHVAPGHEVVEVNIKLDDFLPIKRIQIIKMKVWLADYNEYLLDFRGEIVTLGFFKLKDLEMHNLFCE